MPGTKQSGRRRTPTAVLKRQGTFRTNEHADRKDEMLAVGKPVKPRNMKPAAKKLWEQVTQNLPPTALSVLDTSTLNAMCDSWAWYLELRAVRDMDALKVLATFDKLAARFGMTPSDRAKLHVPDDKKPDPLLDMLAKRGSAN